MQYHRTPIPFKVFSYLCFVVIPFVDVLNKTWTTHRLSPLYQFSTSTIQLQDYSTSLANHIASECANVHSDMVRVNMFLYEEEEDLECVGIAVSLDKAGML